GGFVPPASVGGVTPPEQAAPAPVTAPQIAPGAGSAPQTVATAPVALSSDTGQPLWLWIVGGIGTALLLASLSLSLGAAPPAPASARSHVPLRGAAR
ncbi:MAG TPA: hypothetical protein VHE83_08165, partial [Mycobacteriales bacterium]|nr:hypothetical protein [Mycobacteriales bacterium]